MVIFLFTAISCSKDEEPAIILQKDDIVGLWTCVDPYDQFTMEFNSNGEVYFSGYDSEDEFIDETYSWDFNSEGEIVLTFSTLWINVPVRFDGNIASFEFSDRVFQKEISRPNDTPSENNPEDNPSINNKDHDPAIVGYWWDGDVLEKLSSNYFCPNGSGYKIITENSNSYGVKYICFTWNTKQEGVLEILNDGSKSPFVYNYSIEDGKMYLTSQEGSYTFNYTWRKMGDEYDESFDTSKIPFESNYIYDKQTGYYYEITKITSGCTHAGSNSNSNEKFLNFFGEKDDLFNTGLRIIYYTPSYDGIDSNWGSGTYTINTGSSYYCYKSMCYINKHRTDTYTGDKLSIKISGSTTTYDYDGENVRLHVVKVK